jgi:hypothetical protein
MALTPGCDEGANEAIRNGFIVKEPQIPLRVGGQEPNRKMIYEPQNGQAPLDIHPTEKIFCVALFLHHISV